jgi:hypothetical protein
MKGWLIIAVSSMFSLLGCVEPTTRAGQKVLYDINFTKTSDFGYFNPETEINRQEVTVKNGVLDIDAIKGATVWFKEKLTAPVRIDIPPG